MNKYLFQTFNSTDQYKIFPEEITLIEEIRGKKFNTKCKAIISVDFDGENHYTTSWSQFWETDSDKFHYTF